MTDRPMTDLIRRADALALPYRLSPSLDADDGYYVSVDAIRDLAPVQVDAAHIREESMREAAAVVEAYDRQDGGAAKAILALIPTPSQRCAECDCVNGGTDCNWIAAPSPSPDVGGGSTGFGASYQRETDCWVIYSLPRMAPFARMDGFANENVKWAVEALRAAHIRSSPSPDVGAMAEAISVQTRLIRAGCGGQQNRLDICCDRIDAALAKMKGGAE